MALVITGETATPQVLTGMWSNLINGSLHMVATEPHFTTRVLNKNTSLHSTLHN